MWDLVKGVTCFILAAAAGSASLYMNVTFGLTIGAGMALVFGLSDCVKIIVPLMSSTVGGWTIKRRLAWTVAAVISVIAATSYLLEMQATNLLQSQARDAMISETRSEIKEMRGELSLISEPLSAATLRKLEKEKRDAADREAARGSCGPICERLNGEANKFLERIGVANRRDHLEAQIAKAREKADSVPVKATGASNVLAHLTGLEQAQVATWTSIIAAVLAIVMTEIVAMFSSDAGSILRQWWKKRKGKSRPMTVASTAQVDKLDKTSKMTRERALLAVQTMIWSAPGRILIMSQRSLAEHLGVSPSTLHDWLKKDWLVNGKLKAEGNGTSMKLTTAEAA